MAKEEFKAGIFTLTAVVILSIFIVAISGYTPWQERTTYRTRFPMVVGITAGTPVSLNGVVVGKVEQVDLLDEGTQVEVIFGLDKGRKLRKGVKAEMATLGLIGDTFILLTLAETTGEELPPGSLVPSITKLDLAQTLDAVGTLADRAQYWLERLAGRAETVLADIQIVVNKGSMGNLSAKLESWEGAVSTILQELAGLATEVNNVAREASTMMREVSTGVAKLGPVADEAGLLVADVRSAVGRDQEQLYELLAQFNARMKALGPRLEGLVGALEKAVDRDQDKLYSILSQGDEVVGRVNRAAELTLEDLVVMTRNLAQASRNLISLTERLRNDPSLLIRTRGSGP